MSTLALFISFIRAGLTICSRIELDIPSDATDGVRHDHFVTFLILEGLFNHSYESVINICVLQGRRLKVRYVAIFRAPAFCLLSRDLTITYFIRFIAHDDEWEVLCICLPCMLQEAISPLGQVLKSLLACEIKAEGAAISSFVKSISNGLVLFLASCIPDLHCHDCVVDYHFFFLKISSDSWLGILRVLALGVSHQKGGLTDVGVTENYNF